MKTMHVLAGLVVVAVLSAVAWGAAPAVAEKKAPVMGCPCCPGMTGDMKAGEMSVKMQEMQLKMKEAGVSEQSMKTHTALMNAPLFLDSPEMLLGQADTLGLNDAQKAKLNDVVKDSRAKAAAILTEAQRAKLGKVPEKPMTMMETRTEMMKKMAPKMEKTNKDDGMDKMKKDEGMGGMKLE